MIRDRYERQGIRCNSPLPMTHLVALAAVTLTCLAICSAAAAEIPDDLGPWLVQQHWQRDTEGPVISLGSPGEFDDMHVFAPAVALEDSRYRLWYCGSRGAVDQRVFQLGLAISSDGSRFEKSPHSPVFAFGDGKHSILTPTLLRLPDGSTLREGGKLRMWFSSTDFQVEHGLHTLHETTSDDGIHWSEPSPVQLENVYAPTVIKTGRTYQMWYTDVSSEPWIVRHATSQDGRKWRVTHEPAIVLDQEWEKGNLFYPTVVKIGSAYLMWYGSYWTGRTNTTVLGFAVSLDGMKWTKHPQNPVFRPDPERPWESHYVTSQSVMRLPDGSFRIWYASRTKPPFVNKYYAINTARWADPPQGAADCRTTPTHFTSRGAFLPWQRQTRDRLRTMLGIPSQRVPLEPEPRGQIEHDGVVIEKWVFTAEPGSRVPTVLYRPKSPPGPMPAIVLTFGHGGSKSSWQYHYAGKLYARLGLACLALDPIGEEERHIQGRLGTRAHDPLPVHECADRAGRLIMGKLVFDTMRGIDFLCTREDIDHDRIGVAGNSLGGAKASWMAALEPRLKMAIVSGWSYSDLGLRSKYCTKAPNQRMRKFMNWPEYAALAAPDCAVLVTNGDADVVIDTDGDATAWAETNAAVEEAAKVYAKLGAAGKIRTWYEPGGGHRPYMAYKEALEWIHQHLGTPGWSLEQIRGLPTLNSGQWCDAHGIRLEPLYGTPLHQRGATLPDLGLSPVARERLACLKESERGSPQFTLEGWLEAIGSH